jgi:thiamine pyrophosphate-dependent acetolactate synthase large subunit-like protein
MDLDKPLIDFVGLARSLGVSGTRVEKASDIGPAVGKALASGGPHLVDVRIDPAFA